MAEAEHQQRRTALKRTATVLKQASLPFALAGGYALWARGGAEPTHDVDLVVTEQDVPRVLAVLVKEGLRAEHPPEDWLEKVYDGDVLIDLVFRPAERSVTRSQLARADELDVDAMRMPVLGATEVLVSKLLMLSERSCDFAPLLANARSLREQIDWHRLRGEVSGQPLAGAFIDACEQLGIITSAEPRDSTAERSGCPQP